MSGIGGKNLGLSEQGQERLLSLAATLLRLSLGGSGSQIGQKRCHRLQRCHEMNWAICFIGKA